MIFLIFKNFPQEKPPANDEEERSSWTLWDTHRCQLMWYILSSHSLFFLFSSCFVYVVFLFFVDCDYWCDSMNNRRFISFHKNRVLDERWNRPSQREIWKRPQSITNQRPPSKQNEMLSRVKTNLVGPVKMKKFVYIYTNRYT